MKYDFIPKKLYPYVKILYKDHIIFKDNLPTRYKNLAKHINDNYKIYIDYYILHECDGYGVGNLKSRIKYRLFGKNYIYIPKNLMKSIDFGSLKIKKNNMWSDLDLLFYNEYCKFLKVDMKYFKLKKYIIKTPENPKITVKEHIQMLFGRRCIKFC